MHKEFSRMTGVIRFFVFVFVSGHACMCVSRERKRMDLFGGGDVLAKYITVRHPSVYESF